VIQALDGTIRADGRPSGRRWSLHCLGKPTDPGRSGSDNRRFVEAVLWIVRNGQPVRDLPAFLGNWNTIFSATATGSKPTFRQALRGLFGAPDMEYAMVDATIVRSIATARRKKGLRARHRTFKGGMTTNILR